MCLMNNDDNNTTKCLATFCKKSLEKKVYILSDSNRILWTCSVYSFRLICSLTSIEVTVLLLLRSLNSILYTLRPKQLLINF